MDLLFMLDIRNHKLLRPRSGTQRVPESLATLIELLLNPFLNPFFEFGIA
jgi:hypothetical protein